MPRFTMSSRTSGQSTVEAAVLLPVLLFALALLIQPVCLAYTRTVMKAAAAEAVRLLSTTSSEEDCKAFILRRLVAVPEASPFHVGGSDDWQIDITRGEGGGFVEVSISGHARLLPFLGMLSRTWGHYDEQGLLLKAEATGRLRPTWLEGTYESWIGVWG